MEGLLNKLYIEPIEPIGKFFISLLKLKLVNNSLSTGLMTDDSYPLLFFL